MSSHIDAPMHSDATDERHRSSVAETATATVKQIKESKPFGTYLAAIVCLVVLAWAFTSMLRNPRMKWDIIGEYLFHDTILHGLWVTVWLTVATMAIGCLLGFVLAGMRMSKNPVLRSVAWAYVWVFRALPTLVQLILWFNLAALYPKLHLGIPFGPSFFSGDTNTLISAWTAALLGIGLHQAAYMCEIFRSGLAAIDVGQREAAEALGMSRWLGMKRVILPQAIRIIIPPSGNELITTLKLTSLVSVIAVSDLLYSAELIAGRNFQIMPLLIVASLWYLLITSLLMVGQQWLERMSSKSLRGGVELAVTDPVVTNH